jgi:ABC-2 type transport system permease protein
MTSSPLASLADRLRLAAAYQRAETVELLRYPGFVLPTLGFPALFFLLFGHGATREAATASTAGYAAFAVFGVVFFQFGVGIAQERATPWQLYLRVLPVAPWQRFAARLCSATLFGTVSAAVVIGVAFARGGVSVGATGWLRLGGTLAVGAVPFGLLGIALGYLLSPKAALPLANLVYFGLAYLGGMWTGPDGLHGLARRISPALPTRRWTDLVAGAVGAGEWQLTSLVSLAAWGVAFALVARFAYRRDEARQFR